MFRPLQPGYARSRHAPPPAHAAWLRLVAVLCLSLLAIVSTAQVCHGHPATGTSLTKHSAPDNPGSTPSPDHCPLCLAFHACVPHLQTVALAPICPLQHLAVVSIQPRPRRPVSFQSFCRPPPAPVRPSLTAGRSDQA